MQKVTLNRTLSIKMFVFMCLFSTNIYASNNSTNPYLLNSPWSQGHRTYGMTASSPYTGPFNSERTKTQLEIFKEDVGTNLGTSPWLILSEKKYKDRPNARTVWGASLQNVYKYVIDGDDFYYADHFKLDGITSISWNLIGMHDEKGGRIIVPQPTGLTVREHRKGKCHGRKPALLVFRDGTETSSPITCEKKFELDEELVRKICNPRKEWKMAYSGASTHVLPTGELATTVHFKNRWYQDEGRALYMLILDNQLTKMKRCEFIDNQMISNNAPGEYMGQKTSAVYYPTDDGIVKMVYDQKANKISRAWKKKIPFRGRTGTTPTIVDVGTERFIIAIDGRCAVGGTGNTLDVLTGKIHCSEADSSPSKFVAVSLNDLSKPPYILTLPEDIDTVENSPSSAGNIVVIANYGGYKPTLKTKGVIAVEWNAKKQNWQIAWHNPKVQMNGVTSISKATGLVYSSGMEPDGNVYMYGLKLKTDAYHKGGEIIFRQKVGPADQSWDAGNNTIINDDGSILNSTSAGISRLKQR